MTLLIWQNFHCQLAHCKTTCEVKWSNKARLGKKSQSLGARRLAVTTKSWCRQSSCKTHRTITSKRMRPTPEILLKLDSTSALQGHPLRWWCLVVSLKRLKAHKAPSKPSFPRYRSKPSLILEVASTRLISWQKIHHTRGKSVGSRQSFKIQMFTSSISLKKKLIRKKDTASFYQIVELMTWLALSRNRKYKTLKSRRRVSVIRNLMISTYPCQITSQFQDWTHMRC